MKEHMKDLMNLLEISVSYESNGFRSEVKTVVEKEKLKESPIFITNTLHNLKKIISSVAANEKKTFEYKNGAWEQKPISEKQVRAIWGLLKRKNLEEEYVTENVGLKVNQLNMAQAHKLIKELNK